ncbi:MAG: response regulator receiver protein, partial [Candidatus Solibacter sp.]|nr:response regulator receiver protein [Candidatus Solibacter sp.]
APPIAPAQPMNIRPPAPPKPNAPEPAGSRVEPVRRVNPLRLRSGSILGLDISRPEPESSGDDD